VIGALAEGRRPSIWKRRDFIMEIVPDHLIASQAGSAHGLQLLH
jgi:hypothetical protein